MAPSMEMAHNMDSPPMGSRVTASKGTVSRNQMARLWETGSPAHSDPPSMWGTYPPPSNYGAGNGRRTCQASGSQMPDGHSN
jgi:hypothetical protein